MVKDLVEQIEESFEWQNEYFDNAIFVTLANQIYHLKNIVQLDWWEKRKSEIRAAAIDETTGAFKKYWIDTWENDYSDEYLRQYSLGKNIFVFLETVYSTRISDGEKNGFTEDEKQTLIPKLIRENKQDFLLFLNHIVKVSKDERNVQYDVLRLFIKHVEMDY